MANNKILINKTYILNHVAASAASRRRRLKPQRDATARLVEEELRADSRLTTARLAEVRGQGLARGTLPLWPSLLSSFSSFCFSFFSSFSFYLKWELSSLSLTSIVSDEKGNIILVVVFLKGVFPFFSRAAFYIFSFSLVFSGATMVLPL